MNLKIFMVAMIAISLASCNHSHEEHDSHEGHDHEEVKFQYTSYHINYELFAEADAFVVGETANVLSHFSSIPDFKAVENGKVTIILSVNGKETTQTLDKPTRKGIYSYH
jgi:hypothetical protein